MTKAGQRVEFTSGPRTGQTGTITKVHGPKTVELRMDSGFMLWHVKTSKIKAV